MEKKSGRGCMFLIFCVVYTSWDFLHSPSKEIKWVCLTLYMSKWKFPSKIQSRVGFNEYKRWKNHNYLLGKKNHKCKPYCLNIALK
jgi:hypothetical protein